MCCSTGNMSSTVTESNSLSVYHDSDLLSTLVPIPARRFRITSRLNAAMVRARCFSQRTAIHSRNRTSTICFKRSPTRPTPDCPSNNRFRLARMYSATRLCENGPKRKASSTLRRSPGTPRTGISGVTSRLPMRTCDTQPILSGSNRPQVRHSYSRQFEPANQLSVVGIVRSRDYSTV